MQNKASADGARMPRFWTSAMFSLGAKKATQLIPHHPMDYSEDKQDASNDVHEDDKGGIPSNIVNHNIQQNNGANVLQLPPHMAHPTVDVRRVYEADVTERKDRDHWLCGRHATKRVKTDEFDVVISATKQNDGDNQWFAPFVVEHFLGGKWAYWQCHQVTYIDGFVPENRFKGYHKNDVVFASEHMPVVGVYYTDPIRRNQLEVMPAEIEEAIEDCIAAFQEYAIAYPKDAKRCYDTGRRK